MGNLLGPAFLPGNRVTTLLNGDQVFPAMLQAIRSAKRTITFETYIFWSSDVGKQFAGALSEHLVTPSTSFILPYSIHVADRIIHDAEPRGTETMTVAQILARSSNVGAITLAEKLGQHRLAQWISRFGFGRPTGIDYPGESPGIVVPERHWSGSTIGNVPIGQGIAVTPIQMASAYAAIANRGIWVRPHLVDHVGDGRSVFEPRHRIVTRRVSKQVLAMAYSGWVTNPGRPPRGRGS